MPSGNTPAVPGTTTQYSFGDDKTQLEQYGWFKKNAGGKAQPVALKRPNPFGLFDMHGNAQEWCQDWYDAKWYEKNSPSDSNGPSSGSYRVLRGGTWLLYASYCRSACRITAAPSARAHHYGFRCVRVLDTTADSQLATASGKPALLVIPPAADPAENIATAACQAPFDAQTSSGPSRSLGQASGHDGRIDQFGRNEDGADSARRVHDGEHRRAGCHGLESWPRN